jgi:hypothetical protein
MYFILIDIFITIHRHMQVSHLVGSGLGLQHNRKIIVNPPGNDRMIQRL